MVVLLTSHDNKGVLAYSFALLAQATSDNVLAIAPKDTGIFRGRRTLDFNGRNTGTANLSGNSLNNVLYAGTGNNVINGDTGIDTGIDTASYLYGVTGTAGVTANLATGVVTGSGTDALVGIENLTGSNNADSLTGNTLANSLSGGSGNDSLTGGAGADKLTGGLGEDQFIFSLVTDTGITSTTWDTITDFSSAQLDKINLFAIDADTVASGNQAFTFIGSAAFTAAGQLRYDATAKVLYGSNDADTTAEFAIALTGVTSLLATNFIL